MPTAIALRSSSNVALAGAQLIASRRSPRTRDAYSRDLDAWVVFCADRGFDPDQALLPHAVLYRDVLEKTCAPATVGRRLSSLSLIYGALQASGVVPRNPFDGKLLPRPEISRAGVTPLASSNAVEAILAMTSQDQTRNGFRDTALIRLLYDTGMRRESAVELRREDLDIPNRIARVIVKGGRKEPVTLPDITRTALARWIQWQNGLGPLGPWVFPGARGKHLALTLVNRILAERSDEAGVARVTPHSLRAAFVTEGFDAGLAAHEIQGAVHHKSGETTRRYDRHARGGSVADVIAENRQKKR